MFADCAQIAQARKEAQVRGRLLQPRSIFTATAINHLAYRVADAARARDFYCELLGMQAVVDDVDVKVVSFGTPPRALVLRAGDHHPAVEHVGISISAFDAQEVRGELQGYGFTPTRAGDAAWSIRDPDELVVQVCAKDAVTGAGWRSSPPSGAVFVATAVNHVAYRVRDYGRSRDFYQDLFGMRLAFEDGKKCSLAFGVPEDALYLNGLGPQKRALIDHFAISVADFHLRPAEQALRAYGLDPEPDGAYAWTVLDPDGFRVQICAETGVYPGARQDPYHNPDGDVG